MAGEEPDDGIKDALESAAPRPPPPPEDATPGFIRDLSGGFLADGRKFLACAITGRPLTGAYATAFTAIAGIKGQDKAIAMRAPSTFAVGAGLVKQAVELLGTSITRGLGKRWDGQPCQVNFSWAFNPPPGEVLR